MAVFTAIGSFLFGAGSFMAGLTAAGLRIAAGIAVSAWAKAMQGEPEPAKFGVQGRLQGGEDVPRSIGKGESCTAGSLVWHGTFGAGGTMSARVIALYDLPIRELLYPIVDGVDATLLKGQAHSNYGWPVQQYRKGGVDHLWVKFYDGTQNAADPFLVSTFGSDPDRPYGPDRIGRGVAYVIIFARAPERNDEGDKPLFQGIPNFKFVTHGTRWYNPASDDTVGGSGAHRWDDPGTWGGVGDFNPLVQLYNLMRGIRDSTSGQWLYGMQGISGARLPAANWIAAINDAQAAIAGPNGMEPTYRAGGEIQVGAQVAVTVEALLTAANARLVENGGVYTVYVGPPGAPVMAFTDGEILSTEEQTFSPFFSLADTVNGVDASYPNPAEGWNTKKAPPLLRPDLEPLAGNRRLMASVSLDLVPYPGQVQRLMKWALAEALRARRHTFVLGPEFRVLEPGDVVRWSSARNGYIDKLFRVDGVIYKSNLDVIVDLTEVDPSDYDWNQGTDYRPVIDGPLQLVGPKPMPMQGWQVFPAIIPDDQGRPRQPGIEVWAASGVPSVSNVRVQVRVGDESGPLVFDSDAIPYEDPWKWVLERVFPANTPHVVRGIFVGPPAAEWSGWFAVTTPNVKLTGLDVEIDELAEEIKESVAELDQWTRFNTREEIERQRKAILLAVQGQLGDYNDRKVIRQGIFATSESNRAEWRQDILVATGPGSAIVSRIEELRAEVFDPVTGLPATAEAVNLLSAEVHDSETGLTAVGDAILSLVSSVPGASAEGLIRIFTSATAAGEDVRIALSTAANGSAGPSSSALYLTSGGGNSELLMVAGRIAAITSPTGTKRGLFVVEGDNVYMDNARIRNLTAVNIQANSLDASVINVADLLAQNAAIAGQLTVGSSILIDGPNGRIVVSD